MAEIDDLFNKYNTDNSSNSPTVVNPPTAGNDASIDALINKYSKGRDYSTDYNKDKADIKGSFERLTSGVTQGLKDVATTIGTISPPSSRFPTTPELDTQFQTALDKAKQENVQFGQENQDFESSAGRVIGQTAATVPALPIRGIEAINVGMKAVPTLTAAGTKASAPLINRLGASVATGAVGGGEFGALTSGANDKGILANTAEGVITGALAGPVITAAGTGANRLIKSGLNQWQNVRVNSLVNSTGMPADAVKNIIQRLDDAGYTPLTAQAELNRLGPKATLADLDASLTAEARGLATAGGKPTTILKNRYADRANQAGDETNTIVNKQLGPHIDIEAEKQNIVNAAQNAVGPDYKLAHASNQVLDVQPIIDDINKSLESAVGSKQSRLAEVKSYLYRTFKNTNGDEETIPRFSIKDLHETRIGIDGLLNKMKQEGDSQTSATYRAVNDIRGQVDDLLKQNFEMKSADTKFAEEMKKKDALQTGYDVLKKNLTTDQFYKQFNGQPFEIQDAMRKGMRAYIGDYLEKGSQGEANAAQRLFSKKESNRGNLELAFGQKASGALDALEREEAFRNTEKAVRFGSDTAQNQAIQRRYGIGGAANPEEKGSSVAAQALKGLVVDLATSSPGLATTAYAVKRAGGNALIHSSENRLAQVVEGSADILSRSGQNAKNALTVASRVNKIQQKIAKVEPSLQLPVLKLPAVLAGPTGKNTYDYYNK